MPTKAATRLLDTKFSITNICNQIKSPVLSVFHRLIDGPIANYNSGQIFHSEISEISLERLQAKFLFPVTAHQIEIKGIYKGEKIVNRD